MSGATTAVVGKRRLSAETTGSQLSPVWVNPWRRTAAALLSGTTAHTLVTSAPTLRPNRCGSITGSHLALYARAISNPFRYSSPVEPEGLIDRAGELHQLLELAEGAHNARLIAPRRYGKTSVLRALGDRAERLGVVFVYVNFFGVVTVADIAERIERAYSQQLRGPLARWFDGVRATLRLGSDLTPASLELTDARAQQPLLERLALPRRVFEKTGRRCLIAFDEFQDVLTAQSRIDAVMRSEIEQHADAASYVFTGSQVGMMQQLFGDRRRAFYAQARPLDLGPLAPEEVADFIALRFADTGREIGAALAPLLGFADGHPQRTMLLAHFVWEATAAGHEADEETWASVLDDVLRVQAADELRGAWSRLAAGERRALLAIATGQSPYARSTPQRVGGSRGGGMEHAIRSLLATGDLSEDRSSSTGYRVTDPLLAYWVRAGRGAS